MISEEKAQQIASLAQEAAEKYNGTKTCNDANREIRKYADKIYELSDWHVQLEFYLSDSNFESGQYKITLRSDNKEDKELIQQYWEQIK